VTTVLPGGVGLRDMLDRLDYDGVSYRMLYHWTQRGWVRTVHAGSGRPMLLDEVEQRVVVVMARLVRAGVQPGAAARAARAGVEGGVSLVDLGGGVMLGWLPAQQGALRPGTGLTPL
jgi:hypothetical protein